MIDMFQVLNYREKNWVPYNKIANDFPDLFRVQNYSVLDQAYDEVVRSIRILPGLFKVKFSGELSEDSYVGDLQKAILSDTIAVKFKSILSIESHKAIKGKLKIEELKYRDLAIDFDGIEPEYNPDIEIYLDNNLISFPTGETIRIMAYMYPHFVILKDNDTIWTFIKQSDTIEKAKELSALSELYLNKELVFLMIIKFNALKALKDKAHETFSYLENLFHIMLNMYNEQREHQLKYFTQMSEVKNA